MKTSEAEGTGRAFVSGLRAARTAGYSLLDPFDWLLRRLSGRGELPPLSLRRHAGPVRAVSSSIEALFGLLLAKGLLSEGTTLLDLGCGPGAVPLRLLQERLTVRGYIGIDVHEGRMIPDALESSDQKSFIDRGVPAVQIFTDPHADYHRPGDTSDKIDGPGLVKVATFVKEGIVYLGEREQPLTSTIASMKGAPAAATAGTPPTATPAPAGGGQGRRVSFGTMPDFAFAGPGVKVAGVMPGSPAEKAGVKEGDVLLKIDGKDVADLPGFSGLLRGLTPGQTVKVLLSRGGQEQTLDVTVVER